MAQLNGLRPERKGEIEWSAQKGAVSRRELTRLTTKVSQQERRTETASAQIDLMGHQRA